MSQPRFGALETACTTAVKAGFGFRIAIERQRSLRNFVRARLFSIQPGIAVGDAPCEQRDDLRVYRRGLQISGIACSDGLVPRSSQHSFAIDHFCGGQMAVQHLAELGHRRHARPPRGKSADPQDVSVIGFDDIASAGYLSPTLTTFRQPLEELGSLAAAHLVAHISSRAPRRAHLVAHIEGREELTHEELVQPVLVQRESTRALLPSES
jgi:DNA-binding LacI/PurR family transcriptional regulator